MTDYVGYEKFVEFAELIVPPTIVYLGKFNRIEQIAEEQGKKYYEKHTICMAAWKAPDDIVHYYQCTANKTYLTPVEIVHKIISSGEEMDIVDEAKMFESENTEILDYMEEIIKQFHKNDYDLIAFHPAVFSLPDGLNPPPVQMDERTFDSPWDASGIIDDIMNSEEYSKQKQLKSAMSNRRTEPEIPGFFVPPNKKI